MKNIDLKIQELADKKARILKLIDGVEVQNKKEFDKILNEYIEEIDVGNFSMKFFKVLLVKSFENKNKKRV